MIIDEWKIKEPQNDNFQNCKNISSNTIITRTTNLSIILEEEDVTTQLEDRDVCNDYDEETSNINCTSNGSVSTESNVTASSSSNGGIHCVRYELSFTPINTCKNIEVSFNKKSAELEDEDEMFFGKWLKM